MSPQPCALDETRTARDSRILRNESARLRRALAPRRPRRKGRARHDRTTASAPAPPLTVTFTSIATGDFQPCGLTTTHATGTLASPSV